MSFQAYLATIHQQTGLHPADFKAKAQAAGLLKPGLKATQLTDWLKAEFGLGHGHAMALWKCCTEQHWIATP